MNVATLQDEILSLPALERAKLIDVLWDSLSEPDLAKREKASAAESERRIDAFDSGTLTARDATEVFAELRKQLSK